MADCRGQLSDCSNRAKGYLHLLFLNAKALITRLLFGIIGMITIWRVTDVYDDAKFYLLCLPVLLLVAEFVVTCHFTENGEWKWFCPSVCLCMAGVVPGIWLLQMALYMERENYRKEHDLKECGEQGVNYNATALRTVNGLKINLELPADEWAVVIEQFLFFVLIMGRWLLPKGQLSRDQLSQLLLVYIGIAADSLEFSLETLKIKQVLCNLPLIIIVLLVWTWSLTQFMLVLTSVSAPKRKSVVKTTRAKTFFGGCCQNEIWAIIITMLLQDAPYLVMRLYLLIAYSAISPLIIFFILKNAVLVSLQCYRMIVVCTFKNNDEQNTVDNDAESMVSNPLKTEAAIELESFDTATF